MRKLLERLFKPWPWLALALVCAVLAAYRPTEDRLLRRADRKASGIERNFQALEASLGEWFSDTALLRDLATGCEAAPDATTLHESPFALYIYEGRKLLWWNNHEVLPDPLALEQESQDLLRLPNGFYVLRKQSWNGLLSIGLIPVRNEYSLVNRYLRPAFSGLLQIPEQALLLGPDVPGYQIRDQSGEAVFSLYFPRASLERHRNRLALSLLAFFSTLCGMYLLSRQIANKGQPFLAALVLMAVLLALDRVLLSDSIRWLAQLRSIPLFDPHYYASPGIAGSLGHLLLHAILLVIVALFLKRHVRFSLLIRPIPLLPAWIKAAIPVLLLIALFRALVRVFFSLVADSNIAFELEHFLRLDAFSFAGLMAAALLMANLYLLGHWLAMGWRALSNSSRSAIGSAIFAVLIYVMLWLIGGRQDQPNLLWELTSAAVFLLLVYAFARAPFGRSQEESSAALYAGSAGWLSALLIWSAYFAAVSSALLLRTGAQREVLSLMRYAQQLSSDQDPVMEYLFSGVARSVRQDPFVRNLFGEAYPALRIADDKILNSYLGPYFDRYRISTWYFTQEGRALHSGPSPRKQELDSVIALQSEGTLSEGLFHLVRGNRLEYLARIPVRKSAEQHGTVYISLESKVNTGSLLYPELLMREQSGQISQRYDFAHYKGQTLLSRQGTYPYTLRFPSEWMEGPEASRYSDRENVHFVFRFREQRSVVISRADRGWILPLSLFSYIFLFLLLLGFIVLLPVLLFANRLNGRSVSSQLDFSLRGRIQAFVVMLTLLSFIIIGAITITYFNRQSQEYHRSRLLRKLYSACAEIEYESGGRGSDVDPNRRREPRWPFDAGVQADLVAISEIHGIDLNLYDTLGQLQQSSQPDIFTRGLLSKVMEPGAWQALSQDQSAHWMQNERIGSLEFLSAYRPLQSAEGKTAAYLQVPYFAKEKNQRQEVAGFMVALINVYVLLLVVAGLVALAISNSVTRSLATISAQFRKVRVGERNEPIVWSSRDEIGLLVSEYNKMLAELERSAAMLARSERESAWREMARQVAHEIKNPLTPMRLSIQHLQRAIAAGDPSADELTQRVSRTLLEQIETLSHIATEFSNFAQMPRSRPERVAMSSVLQSAVELFKAEEQCDLQLQLPGSEAWVWADRDQLLRVFTNLIKNALQAIPDDRRGQIHISMASSATQVRAEVQDNGCGIEEDMRSRVFMPNFTTKSSGMGLGLAMSKNIIESAGGSIAFESVANQGSTFSVTLPLIPPDAPYPSKPSNP